jgi:hypothetical protein
MTRASINDVKGGGLRAVCESSAQLQDLCHHAEYRIYINGQYVESAGNLGLNAARVLEFWQRRRRGQSVEARAIPCRVRGCPWGQS